VIISHDHYDHLNKYSVQHLYPKTNKFIVPMGVGDLIAKWGVSPYKIVELDWWQEYNLDEQLMFAATPVQHFSGRGLSDRNKTLWSSWVIKTPKRRLFFSGDSGYFDGFKQIGEMYGPFDMTFIECGAYNQAWAQVHMFPEETVQAHVDLKGKVLHPIHWGTFNLAIHAWYEPLERLTAAARARQLGIAIPQVGETTRYGDYLPVARWWQEAMAKKTETKMKNL
jgi:L-ascorbate metabolism protein UlaG (beta-lactamase superfamily)